MSVKTHGLKIAELRFVAGETRNIHEYNKHHPTSIEYLTIFYDVLSQTVGCETSDNPHCFVGSGGDVLEVYTTVERMSQQAIADAVLYTVKWYKELGQDCGYVRKPPIIDIYGIKIDESSLSKAKRETEYNSKPSIFHGKTKIYYNKKTGHIATGSVLFPFAGSDYTLMFETREPMTECEIADKINVVYTEQRMQFQDNLKKLIRYVARVK
jgi:hypothetical protein